MKKTLNYLLIILSVAVIAACTSDNEEDLFGDVQVPEEVSLSADIMPIMNAKCALSGCHVSGGTFPDLSTKSSVIARASRVKARTRVGGGMPKTGSISAEQRTLIGAWVDQGAKDN